VQVQRFRVDYLKKPDAIRLITEPVKLIYPMISLCGMGKKAFNLHPGISPGCTAFETLKVFCKFYK
jgi:hypothetical protein